MFILNQSLEMVGFKILTIVSNVNCGCDNEIALKKNPIPYIKCIEKIYISSAANSSWIRQKKTLDLSPEYFSYSYWLFFLNSFQLNLWIDWFKHGIEGSCPPYLFFHICLWTLIVLFIYFPCKQHIYSLPLQLMLKDRFNLKLSFFFFAAGNWSSWVRLTNCTWFPRWLCLIELKVMNIKHKFVR